MKRSRRAIVGLFLAVTMVMAMAVSIAAAPAPNQLTIKGNLGSMYVGQVEELDSRILPVDANVRDSSIMWTSSSPSVVKVLEKYDDDTKVKALKEGKAVITVTVKGTNLSAKRTITVKKVAAASVSNFEKKIAKCRTDLKTIYQDIRKAKVSNDYRSAYRQYRSFELKIEKVEDRLDVLEDKIEYTYERGKITRNQYRSLENRLDKVDDYASDIEDYLEDKFGDFDD